MKYLIWIKCYGLVFLTCVGFILTSFTAQADEIVISPEDSRRPLRSLGEKDVSLHDLKKYKFVVVVAQGSCPVLQKSYPDLLALEKQFQKKQIAFFLLSPARQEDFADMEKEVKAFGVSKFVLYDPLQVWLQALGLKTMGEAVLLQPLDNSWRVLYRGSVSDRINFDRTLPKAKNEFLRRALTEAINGHPIKSKSSQVYGCSITWLNRNSLGKIHL